MKFKSIVLLALAAASLPIASHAETISGFIIGVSNAPPPPRVVFREEPRMVVVPSTTVYVISDNGYPDDFFRCGSYWFVYRSGYWYRAKSYGGPFVVVDVRSVPRAVINVPQRYWKRHPHGGPPGQMKKVSSPGHGKSGKGKGHKG